MNKYDTFYLDSSVLNEDFGTQKLRIENCFPLVFLFNVVAVGFRIFEYFGTFSINFERKLF